jgi:hypothetical protein
MRWFTKASKGGKRPSGLQRLINEAKRQEKAANGTPIEWRVRDTGVANAIRRVFRENDIGIDVVDVSKPTGDGTRMRMI